MIRRAIREDVPRAELIFKRWHEKVLKPFGFEYDARSTQLSVTKFIDSGIVFVAQDDNTGAVQGCIAGMVVPHPLAMNVKIFNEVFWYVIDRGKGVGTLLLNAVEDYCREHKVSHLVMTNMANYKNSAFAKLYEKKGFKLLENHYIKGF